MAEGPPYQAALLRFILSDSFFGCYTDLSYSIEQVSSPFFER
jgi:hypothetical protein